MAIPVNIISESALLGWDDVVPTGRLLVLQVWADKPFALPDPWVQDEQWVLTTLDGEQKYFAQALALAPSGNQEVAFDWLFRLNQLGATHGAILVAVHDTWTDRAVVSVQEKYASAKATAGKAIDKVADLAEHAAATGGQAWDLVDFVVTYAVPILVFSAVLIGGFIVFKEVKG